MKLYLKKSHYNTILTHCTAGLPNESCGLLAGTEEDEEITVTKVYLLTNVDTALAYKGKTSNHKGIISTKPNLKPCQSIRVRAERESAIMF